MPASSSAPRTARGDPSANPRDPTRDPRVATKEQMLQELRNRRGVLGGKPAAVASRYGLVDPTSQAELELAIAPKEAPALTSSAKRLDLINVLEWAFVDPETRAVTFVGRYDPRYATGPLDYRALTADALRNPHPAFSLKHDGKSSTPARLDADLSRLSQDPGFAMGWLERLVNPVIYAGPTLGPEERALLTERLAQMRISPEEHAAYAAWVGRGKTTFASPEEFLRAREFMSKLLMSKQVPPEVGRGLMCVMRALSDPNQETGLDIYVQLGIPQAYYEIRQRRWANEIDADTAGTLMVAAYGDPILRGLGYPEAEVRPLVEGLRQGRLPQEAVLDKINARWEALTKEALVGGIIHGFRFTGATMGRLYNIPPVLSGVDLFGNPADSPIMRAFFEADYALKFVSSGAPAATAQAAPLPAFQQYLVDRGSDGRSPRTGVNRYWIAPGQVELIPLLALGGVRFGSATLRIRAESLESAGGDPAGVQSYSAALSAYGDLLTQRYDELAQRFPSLHTLRESAKALALARHLNATGQRVDLALAPKRDARPVPASVEGFWGLTYIVEPRGESDTLVYWVQGGVTFDPREGEAWVAARPDPTIEKTALGQLAASAALAEKAAVAANAGDLEAARDLADKSARAMTGDLDFGSMGNLLPAAVPIGAGDSRVVVDGATQVAVTREALAIVEQSNTTFALARSQVAAAEPLREADPAAWKAATEAASEQEGGARDKVRKLHVMLEIYRETPVHARALVTQMKRLESDKIEKNPAQPIELQLPDCVMVKQELADLRAELERANASLRRLQKSMQSDQAELESWSKEANDAIARADKRGRDFVRDKLLEYAFSKAEWYYKVKSPNGDRLHEVEKLKVLSETTKLIEWGAKKDTSWTYLAEGLKAAVERLPLSQPAKDLMSSVEQIIDSSFDITAWTLSWRAIERLDKQSQEFLRAVEKTAQRQKEVVQEIQAIETRTSCPP